MAVGNLGVPHLGATSIPESERTAWPSRRFPAPQRIDFRSADSVTNEVYFRRSTAMARAEELLGSTIAYMAFHVGVSPNPTYYPTFGAGSILVEADIADDESAGIYYDYCNGQLIVEHVKDASQSVRLTFDGKAKDVSTVHHFHVATYGKDKADPYEHVDWDKVYRQMYEKSAAGIKAQEALLRSFGTGIRQYLPIYYHTSESPTPGSSTAVTVRLRVPAGLPSRRTYQIEDRLRKHHIYYLNFPSSPYFLPDADWR